MQPYQILGIVGLLVVITILFSSALSAIIELPKRFDNVVSELSELNRNIRILAHAVDRLDRNSSSKSMSQGTAGTWSGMFASTAKTRLDSSGSQYGE